MKKCVAVVLFLVLVFLCHPSFSEGNSFSSLSDEELIGTFDAIQQELIHRKIIKSGNIGEGAYEVGVDIAPGIYSVEKPESCYYSSFYIFPSRLMYEKYVELEREIDVILDYQNLVGESDPITVTLTNGEVFFLNKGEVMLIEQTSNLAP